MSGLVVGIHTHGGPGIGLGHVRRCLTLADALARLDARVTFVVNDDPGVLSLVGRHGFEAVRVFQAPGQPAPILRVLAERRAYVLVTDSYDIGTDYLAAVCRHVEVLVALDDLADRPLPVDVVVNGAVGAEMLPYPTLTGARLLLGPAYSLLRDEFALEPERSIRLRVGRILVTVGGGDPQNLTRRLVQWVRETLPDVALDVVIGPFFASEPGIADARTTLHRDPQNMCNLMLACDLALCGGGQTTYELAATGTPALAVQVAENQTHSLAGLSRAGTLVLAGDVNGADLESRVKTGLASLVNDVERRAMMSANGRALVDGRGAQRVAQAIVEYVGGRL